MILLARGPGSACNGPAPLVAGASSTVEVHSDHVIDTLPSLASDGMPAGPASLRRGARRRNQACDRLRARRPDVEPTPQSLSTYRNWNGSPAAAANAVTPAALPLVSTGSTVPVPVPVQHRYRYWYCSAAGNLTPRHSGEVPQLLACNRRRCPPRKCATASSPCPAGSGSRCGTAALSAHACCCSPHQLLCAAGLHFSLFPVLPFVQL